MRRAFFIDLSPELENFPWWQLWACLVIGTVLGFCAAAGIAWWISSAMYRIGL
jgi:hypothetical protein